MIAEGSETVFVAGKNVARKGDKTTCSAVIQNGSPNVFIGSGKAQVAKIADEFSLIQKTLLVAVEMGFPPSQRTLKSGLGKIRLGIDDFSRGVKDAISNRKFIETLKNKQYVLEGVFMKKVDYIKRDPLETGKLRKAFNIKERREFLKDLGKQQHVLEKQGFSKIEIAKIQNGRVPDGWQVHHKLPLDDSGTNNFDNLVLIKNDPFHKVITNHQSSVTRDMQIGEIRSIEWPIINGKIYPIK